MRSVLIVDDNPLLVDLSTAFFESNSFQVRTETNAPDALRNIREAIPDMLFSDIVMPGAFDGFQLAKIVARDFPSVKILLTTGWGMAEYSPFRVLVKPYSVGDLKAWITANGL